MALPESPSLIHEYSQIFTDLQNGKRTLIKWGVDAVLLNRYIVDAAESTGETDSESVIRTIDLTKVTSGDSEQQRLEHCQQQLSTLVTLQEQVKVLQKSAGEMGISGGLLTIVGQAAVQSPHDNGSSVLRQLGELVGDESSGGKEVSQEGSMVGTEAAPEEAAIHKMAANDAVDVEPGGYRRVLSDHWASFLFDAGVCAVATSIALSLIL